MLDDVETLGNKKYSSYAADPGPTNEAPWKVSVKAQADKLIELARRGSHRNEETWRFSCESTILDRLSAEVVWYVPVDPEILLGSDKLNYANTVFPVETAYGARRLKPDTTMPVAGGESHCESAKMLASPATALDIHAPTASE